ncbi:hypothetical protein CR513_01628, partial [Mucuna pruriens]
MTGRVSCGKCRLVEVEICRLDEYVCKTPPADCANYTCLYDTIPFKLGAWVPFIDFQCSVLKTLNITSTQLHLNGWAFVRAFEILFKDLGKPPPSNCDGGIDTQITFWMPLGNRVAAPLVPVELKTLRKKKSQLAIRTVGTSAPSLGGIDLSTTQSREPVHKRHWEV